MTNQTLKEQADKVGNSKTQLKKRLLAARSVLLKEYRQLFNSYTFNFEEKRMYCEDKSHALEWHNSGATSMGSVLLRKLPNNSD